MPSEMLDAFADVSGWTSVASGQAQLQLSQDQGVEDHALRLDFDFHGGGGFIVARKPFAILLPEAYTFSFYLRGVTPHQRFEFKLIDAQGYNVWWYHHDAFDFPADWQLVHISHRQIEFAWGPAGGGRMAEVGAIEFVIAAGTGSKGTIWMSGLRFEDTTYRENASDQPRQVRFFVALRPFQVTPPWQAFKDFGGASPIRTLTYSESRVRVVDHTGPDWLAEHDSHGEFIYSIMEYVRFTADRALLSDMWPAVLQAVAYIEALRSQHLTPVFQTAAATNRTFEQYLEHFRTRRSGTVAWINYTPYEMRIIGALTRLG